MRVVVIGASGFTGRHLLETIPAGWEVTATARSSEARSKIERLGARPIDADLDRPETVTKALAASKPDAVIVVASLGFGHADALIESIRSAGSPRTLFTSTTGIFTKLAPASKAVRLGAELSIAHSALPYTIVRPTMIYGAPGDRNMERLLRTLRRLPVLPAPAGGRTLQQPVHVDDLAQAMVAAVGTDEAIGQAIDIAGPDPLPFSEIVRLAGVAIGRRRRVVPVPVGPVRRVVGLQERLLRPPRLKVEQIDRLMEDKAFPIDDAIRLLGYRPRSFAEGIRQEAEALFGRSEPSS